MSLILVDNISKRFPAERNLFGVRRFVHAVNGVSFEILAGETFALVGESGCGKSTTGRILLGLELASSGVIRYKGKSLAELDKNAQRDFRRRVQVIFQDTNSSLNPRKTIGQTLLTALRATRADVKKEDRTKVAIDLLESVGLSPANTFMRRYPHELSGGQRQRVGIARALAPEPELIIADEPVSALDISVRAQILTLLDRLQQERGLAYLFISHDLAVVRSVAQRVGVMYLGKLVELGGVDEVFSKPIHPYTEVLIDATPNPKPAEQHERLIIKGDVPSPIDLPSGCAFHTRCPIAEARCKTETPELKNYDGQFAACHLAEQRLAGLTLPRKEA